MFHDVRYEQLTESQLQKLKKPTLKRLKLQVKPVEAKLAGQDTSEKITANSDVDKSVLGGVGSPRQQFKLFIVKRIHKFNHGTDKNDLKLNVDTQKKEGRRSPLEGGGTI